MGIRTNIKRFPGVVFPKSSGPMSGRAGCFSSIRQVIKQAKNDNIDNVLIFEDDVLFLGDTIEVLRSSLGDLSEVDWQMFYLGASVTDEFSKAPLKKVTDNLLKMEGGQCTHAFACHSSIYDEILDNVPDIDTIIPWMYRNESMDKWLAKTIQIHYNVYCTNPMVATQRPSWSDIDDKHSSFGEDLVERFNSFLTKEN
jgi:GR25 family glycosyltransferase involved in LPS biosynthesis